VTSSVLPSTPPLNPRKKLGRWRCPVDHELRTGKLAREAIEAALLTREAFPCAGAPIENKFSIEDVDDDQMWLFSLYHKEKIKITIISQVTPFRSGEC
jgi:hypothetical protein